MTLIKPWHGQDIVTCAEALADFPYTLFLDSSRLSHPLSQWSFLCWNPSEIITVKNNQVFLNSIPVQTDNLFEFLQSFLQIYNRQSDETIPFTGGLAGYFGYDLGFSLNPIEPKNNSHFPDTVLGVYTNILSTNHHTGESWLIGEEPDLSNHRAVQYKPQHVTWQSDKSDKEFCTDIQMILDEIEAGEVYQVNLSRNYQADLPSDFHPFSHYKILRETNSAPYSAYLHADDFHLLSCSPERFLTVKDKQVETRPIKGTLPITESVEKLSQNPKERAENIMVVDLLRNDLSKSCKLNSVQVPKLCDIEEFEGLYHMVSTVTGALAENETPLTLLKKSFPGGSITGAPKIAAMKTINNLEENPRGPYCGAMGYIGFDGSMDMNILIRTLLIKDGKASLNVGSGIVYDSVPEKELAETKQKAQKIWESFK